MNVSILIKIIGAFHLSQDPKHSILQRFLHFLVFIFAIFRFGNLIIPPFS